MLPRKNAGNINVTKAFIHDYIVELPMKSLSSLIVSRALCAGALFCWNISQGSVATHLRWGGIFINNLLQISNWVRWWKNCENRSIFSKDMDKSIVSPFLTHGVYKGISISLGKAGWRLCWKTRVILMYFNCFYILPLVIGQPSYTW